MNRSPFGRSILVVAMWLLTARRSKHALSYCIASCTTSAAAALSSAIPRVVVPRNRQSKAFREGNPLVFGGAVAYTASEEKALDLASLVAVEVQTQKPEGAAKRNSRSKKKPTKYPHYDSEPPQEQTQIIGWGVYNPHSMYRVRILCHATTHPKLARHVKDCDSAQEALASIVHSKLVSAMQARIAIGLPSDQTDTYRLVNGEGDGLSGLAVDVLGGRVAVVMSSAAWCEIHKETIVEALNQAFSSHSIYSEEGMDIVWKTTPERLKQDGLEISLDDDKSDSETADRVVLTRESGIQYQSFPYELGQKTGVYCDQRENRFNLALLCRDKRVLDLCCYHGGFSLNAKVHGAAHCTGVDSSQDAIDIAIANSKLNGCEENIEFVREDIADFMRRSHGEDSSYDVIVLDPPKLAPSATGLDRASRKYHSLNRDALKLISPTDGGLLMTCTCSAAMTQKDGGKYFLDMVQQAAIAAGRHVTLLRVSGAAPCHTQSPGAYPAGAYLTAALFHVSPI